MPFTKKICGVFGQPETSAMTLSVLLALIITPIPLAVSLLESPVWAQSASPAFPLPTSVPNGTTVRINGSSTMEPINQALRQQFTAQFSGTTVETESNGSDAALQDVLSGEIDLAAIGRPLTEEEQAQGLVAVPVARNKIAVIISADNPFDGSLTANQFADIFRGEITSWSQVGGLGALRFVDRPDDSDLRQTLQSYSVFRNAPFQTGLGAVQVTEDSTEAVIAELGTNGISYAVLEQIANNPNIRAILLHDTSPTDPGYPFSQPLSYVYRGPTPSPEVQAFLGYATAPESQLVVEEARRAGLLAGAATIAQASPTVSPTASPETASPETASPSPTATATSPSPAVTVPASPEISPSPTATATAPLVFESETTTTESDRATPLWWLLLLAIPIIGALLWWWLRGRSVPSDVATGAAAGAAADAIPPIAPVIPVSKESHISLTPRNCRDADVHWEVPESVLDDQRQQTGRPLVVRLYDVTDFGVTDDADTEAALDHQSLHSVQQVECDEQSQDLYMPIPIDDRDYIAELGYQTGDDRWICLARSARVRVPACEPTSGMGTAESAITPPEVSPVSPEVSLEASQLPDTTEGGIPDQTIVSASATPTDGPVDAMDETLGKPATLIDDSPKPPPGSIGNVVKTIGAAIAGSTAIAGAGQAVQPFQEAVKTDTVGDRLAGRGASDLDQQCRIILVPRNAQSAYAYWEVANHYKEELRQQGGQVLMLRIHDATNLDMDYQPAHSTQDYVCDESERDKHVTIPESDRDYVAELGYVTEDGHWLRLIRSLHVRVPADNSSL